MVDTKDDVKEVALPVNCPQCNGEFAYQYSDMLNTPLYQCRQCGHLLYGRHLFDEMQKKINRLGSELAHIRGG